jgi:hypothetical protein
MRRPFSLALVTFAFTTFLTTSDGPLLKSAS